MLYIIEKILPKNYGLDDVIEINDLLINAEKVHKLLGKLFNTEKESNWREKYNILYRQLKESGKWIVQSDIPICEENARKLSIIFNKVSEKNLSPNMSLALKVKVAPFKPDENGKRKKIKLREDRFNWLKQKFTYNDECEVLTITEFNPSIQYMEHEDTLKGKAALTGYDYSISVKIKDLDGFKKLLQKGIGPCKNYGFGLITMV